MIRSRPQNDEEPLRARRREAPMAGTRSSTRPRESLTEARKLEAHDDAHAEFLRPSGGDSPGRLTDVRPLTGGDKMSARTTWRTTVPGSGSTQTVEEFAEPVPRSSTPPTNRSLSRRARLRRFDLPAVRTRRTSDARSSGLGTQPAEGGLGPGRCDARRVFPVGGTTRAELAARVQGSTSGAGKLRSRSTRWERRIPTAAPHRSHLLPSP